MVQQQLPFRNRVEDVVSPDQPVGQAGGERRVFQVVPLHEVVGFQQPVEIDRAVDLVEVTLLEAEHVQQVMCEIVGAVVRDLEPHRRAVAARDQLALERPLQVIDFLWVDVQVAVARHAELVAAGDLHAAE